MAGPTQAASFSAQLVTCTLGTATLTALDEGEPIVVERASADTLKFKEGLYGDVIVSISQSRLYVVTFKLMAMSRSQRVLQQLHDTFVATGRGWQPLVVADLNDDTAAKFSSPKACVMTCPGLKRGAEVAGDEWKLLCANGKLVHTGGSDAS